MARRSFQLGNSLSRVERLPRSVIGGENEVAVSIYIALVGGKLIIIFRHAAVQTVLRRI